MAKRANPFVEDFVPQSKVYVGIKQFNNNEDRLKKVYEKTLDLLFKGAKKTLEHDHLNNNDLNFIKKDKMKQLFIGKDGTLLHSGGMIPTKSELQQCGCGSMRENPCSYCETSLCGQCQHCCLRCDRYYCSRCILGSDDSEVCVSCYE